MPRLRLLRDMAETGAVGGSVRFRGRLTMRPIAALVDRGRWQIRFRHPYLDAAAGLAYRFRLEYADLRGRPHHCSGASEWFPP